MAVSIGCGATKVHEEENVDQLSVPDKELA
jgi:hypothetical protein